MNILLNIIMLLLLVTFGLYRLTKNSPEKRGILLNSLKDAPINFYKNCKIVFERIKEKEK
ncbi:hypothetical protein [Bacillus sp. 445_BSPC]|uniref:hypothetical protein n=1 Tax=Bacillus sp. 445_BSPC TaxID=1581712 RepID=UPI000AC14C7D|nr:hypothetical protein [Bacillus sp. 445_BSPC]